MRIVETVAALAAAGGIGAGVYFGVGADNSTPSESAIRRPPSVTVTPPENFREMEKRVMRKLYDAGETTDPGETIVVGEKKPENNCLDPNDCGSPELPKDGEAKSPTPPAPKPLCGEGDVDCDKIRELPKEREASVPSAPKPANLCDSPACD